MTAIATRPPSSSSRSSASTATPSDPRLVYEPRGAARDLFHCRAPEVLVAGPAGTGKSRACLEKMHQCLQKYDGARALVLRKTLTALTASGLATYRKAVLHPGAGVTFFGGNREEPAQYRYANGSVLVMGGMDKASKIMSTEYDLIYPQEATEITEAECDALTTRLRNGMMPYQQLLADCNPDAPTHWLKLRCEAGRMLMLESRHEDNPVLHDGHAWTAEGRRYISVLDNLSGVRKDRLRYGRWVAAEGVVYETFDARTHVIAHSTPVYGERLIRAIDFGYTNPFVCQWWRLDRDGRLALYRELYRTQRLVEDHARQIVALTGSEPIEATVCDHDAEDRATLERHGIPTVGAYKDIARGIQAVQARLRVAGDGQPRLRYVQDALVERDEALAYAGKPISTVTEKSWYRWPIAVDGKPVKEIPVDEHNHGQDAERYAVAYVDGLRGDVGALDADLAAQLADFTGLG